MSDFKLYVWTDVLIDYTSGIVFAVARTPEEAAEAVKSNGLCESHFGEGGRIDGELPTDYPLDRPKGFYLHGGG